MSGLLVTLFAMGVAMIPPGDDAQPALFVIKVVGGALAFVLIGGIVYWRAQRVLDPSSHEVLVDLGARVHAELREDVLGVMACRVLADPEGGGELGVRATQPQQLGDLELALGQAERRQRQGGRVHRRSGRDCGGRAFAARAGSHRITGIASSLACVIPLLRLRSVARLADA